MEPHFRNEKQSYYESKINTFNETTGQTPRNPQQIFISHFICIHRCPVRFPMSTSLQKSVVLKIKFAPDNRMMYCFHLVLCFNSSGLIPFPLFSTGNAHSENF
ncbi:hypothetical protein TNIN_419211 [Trichonephila inaurata madagascariensis]|uniref:Uncharacterized protein n=1 Tax=Trichonephila inaurata madagascariensis TaxID=2747483 RepID=A0A8X6XV25_9ARAC|nr:hypothetical protein TNIN_419211 [Trichonephila inaurata madagascariensis]